MSSGFNWLTPFGVSRTSQKLRRLFAQFSPQTGLCQEVITNDASADDLADSGQFHLASDTYRELLEKVMATHPDPQRDATMWSHIYQSLATNSFIERELKAATVN